MSTPPSRHDTILPPDAHRRIADACDRFNEAWRAGNSLPLEDFLYDGGTADERRELLRALLEVEFRHRRQTQGSFSVDEHLARYSEHADLVRDLFTTQTFTPPASSAMPSSGAASIGPAEEGADAPELPDRFGRYRVTGTLGRGAYGVVYRGRDDRLQRDVAIKLPCPELVERLGGIEAYLREARVVAALDHPNIVPVYDVDHTADGLCYVVYGLVDGSDLRTRLDQGPSFSPADAARLVAALARALQHAHRKGVYHRDIKPANILLDRSGKPYLTDFGIAQEQEDYGKGLTFAGTPAYMSPEQARRRSDRVDGRSDIFSLGAVFYEMLVGQRPFQGSADQVLDRIANGEARPPRELTPEIPAELERICLKAMALSLRERYTAAAALAADLQAWLDADSAPPQAASADSSGMKYLAYAILIVAFGAWGAWMGKKFGEGNPMPPVQPIWQHHQAPPAGQKLQDKNNNQNKGNFIPNNGFPRAKVIIQGK